MLCLLALCVRPPLRTSMLTAGCLPMVVRRMISLRFLNFRSRGYGASPQTIEHNVRWLAQQETANIALTVETFLQRKIVVKSVASADEKLAVFQKQLVEDFSAALGVGQGEAWFAQHIAPVAARLRAELLASGR